MAYRRANRMSSEAPLVTLGAEANARKFGGKELLSFRALQFCDYGPRLYDPAFGLFRAQDPLDDQHRRFSSYLYCAANPVNLADPTGREGLRIVDNKNQTIYIMAHYYTYYEGNENIVSNLESIVNNYLNVCFPFEVTTGEYKGYSINFLLTFSYDETLKPYKEDRQVNPILVNGHNITNCLYIGDRGEYSAYMKNKSTDEDGTTHVVGGVTSDKYNIFFDKQYFNINNLLHEIFHTLGFSHEKGIGGTHGVMKYPPETPDDEDAVEMATNSYLSTIILK